MKSFVWFHRRALTVALLLLGALASRASADTFDLFADDYGTLTINGQLIATVDTSPGGDTSGSVDLTPGWYSIAIDYKNRWGSTGLKLSDQPTADDPMAMVSKSRLESLGASGNLIEGLHADYYTLDGTLLGTVYGEGPIDHGYYNRYEGTSAYWGNGLVDGNWGLFEERLTGQIYVGATSTPEPSTFVLLGIGAASLLAYTWRRRRQAAFALACTVLITPGLGISSASASTMFTEDFSDNSPGPDMALGTGYGSPTTSFASGNFAITSSESSRIYLGTLDTDYASANFDFWATVTVPNTASAWSIPFFGMGSATASSYYGEPSAPNLLFVIRPDQLTYETRDNSAGTNYGISLGVASAAGTHRLHMHWDATTEQATFQLDLNYTGTFASDFAVTVNGADNGFNATNSQLIVGGGYGIFFDDISVSTVPEPGSLVLLATGLLGAFAYAWRRRRQVA